ncbi:MAG: GNAT family N-acetyltransferase [Candidatus Bathyarchaeota archaeon]|nr:MAG: GNAT family N-acetyltransferase [Candidatus Bathyarchaeota archaeon]
MESSGKENSAVHVIKEASGLQKVYRLLNETDCTLGRAVISETAEHTRLHEIYIKPDCRGKGYGSILIQAIIREGRSKLITLCTGFTNVSFFKRHEFQVTGASDSLAFMSWKASDSGR